MAVEWEALWGVEASLSGCFPANHVSKAVFELKNNYRPFSFSKSEIAE